MAGTFRLVLVDVSNITTRAASAGASGWQANGGVADSDFLEGMNHSDVANLGPHITVDDTDGITGSMTFGFSHSLACISLDGDPTLITFDDLPAGFTVTAAQAQIDVTAGMIGNSVAPASTVTVNLLSGTFKVGLFLTDTVTPDTATGNFNGSFGTSVGDSLQIDYPEGTTISDMLSLDIQITLAGSAVMSGMSPNPPNRYWQATLGTTSFSVTGGYDIQLFQFQLAVENESPVTPGDTIELTSNPQEEHPLDFNDVTEVVINYKTTDNVDHTITITNFIAGPNSLTFILPDIEDAPEIEIELTVDGTQFSGSVPAGTLLTIFFTNGTGIYRFVPGKTNDTLYDQDYDPVTTVDVKIPNPFFKTGFLPDA